MAEGKGTCKLIYQLTQKSEFSKDFGLRDQMRRAAISIISNIAEGFERQTNMEFKQFLYIAKGSSAEIKAQSYAALDLKYITEEDFAQIQQLSTEIAKMLNKFISYLKTN